jgi:hypothetical protein
MRSFHDLPPVFDGGQDGAEDAWFFVRAAQTSLCPKEGRLDLDGWWDQQPTTPLGYWQSKGQSANSQDTPDRQ